MLRSRRIHLSGEIRNLGLVSNVFEEDQILRIERDGPVFFAGVKYVLRNVNHAGVGMVTYSRKEFCHHIVRFMHQVIYDDQTVFIPFKFIEGR